MENPLPITSSEVTDLFQLRSDSAYRKKSQRAVIFGVHLLREVLLYQKKIKKQVIISIGIERGSNWPLEIQREVEECLAFYRSRIYYCELAAHQFEKISGLHLAEKCLVEIDLSQLDSNNSLSSPESGARLLILDHLADPGNSGTLLRSATALGWKQALALNGVDWWNDKVIRAAQGAHFYGSLYAETILEASTPTPFLEQWQIVIADSNEGVSPAEIKSQLSSDRPLALVLGNEARGPSTKYWSNYGSQLMRVKIPLKSGFDSLNVAAAGAILLHIFGQEG